MTVELDSEFLDYLARVPASLHDNLPPMHELAETLGMSISKLREQVEVARTLGWVEVRPRRGIEARAFSPAAAMSVSMRFSLAQDRNYFDQIEELREVIEASYWYRAVEALQEDDRRHLTELMKRAWQLLKGDPVQIPHEEHRELHLTIFSRLENQFVKGFLEAYWDAYECVGLNVFTDYAYLEAVWNHHQSMVDAINDQDLESGYRSLVDHFGILNTRPGTQAQLAGSLNGLKLTPQEVSGSTK
ncbi:MAG: FCD domain-containing protein [Anaerolineales bacterium]|jgi:DNA-binding FadR family transcriptional regulator